MANVTFTENCCHVFKKDDVAYYHMPLGHNTFPSRFFFKEDDSGLMQLLYMRNCLIAV